jgi:hypothetical protein
MKKLHVVYLSVALVFVTALTTNFFASFPKTSREHQKEVAKAIYLLLAIERQLELTGLKENDYNFYAYSDYIDNPDAPILLFGNASNAAYHLKTQRRDTEENKKLLKDYQIWLAANPAFKKDFEGKVALVDKK